VTAVPRRGGRRVGIWAGTLALQPVRPFRKSTTITVGDRALADLHVRAATEGGRATASESRDWLMVKSVMHPGERARARVAVRFPHEGNAAGYAFVTDQRVMFAFLERVVSVNLPYVVRLGRPAGPTLGDFEVVAQMPGPHAGYVATTMRVRDHNAFHGFFPTLLDAVRANGAQPEVDASWGGDLDERSLPVPDEAPSSQVMDRALARFMKDRERIVSWMLQFLPEERPLADRVWRDVDRQLGNYIRGKFLEIAIVGVVTYIGFALIGLHLYLVIRLGITPPPWTKAAAGYDDPPTDGRPPRSGLVSPAPRGNGGIESGREGVGR
jgi:hypothetical protein